jgi:hypothetical protein
MLPPVDLTGPKFDSVIARLVGIQGPYIAVPFNIASSRSQTSDVVMTSSPPSVHTPSSPSPFGPPTNDPEAENPLLVRAVVLFNLHFSSRDMCRSFIERDIYLEPYPLLKTLFAKIRHDSALARSLSKLPASISATVAMSRYPMDISRDVELALLMALPLTKLSLVLPSDDKDKPPCDDHHIESCMSSEYLSEFREKNGVNDETVFSVYIVEDVSYDRIESPHDPTERVLVDRLEVM